MLGVKLKTVSKLDLNQPEEEEEIGYVHPVYMTKKSEFSVTLKFDQKVF